MAAGRRLAGVSSFGSSGTNAHVVVEEAPEPPLERPEFERPCQVLALSAKQRCGAEGAGAALCGLSGVASGCSTGRRVLHGQRRSQPLRASAGGGGGLDAGDG